MAPRDALNSGISMIHQEINPLLDMTVSANIFLGREPLNKTGLVNERKLAEDTKKLFESLDINDISPNMLMRELSVAQMQQVEIAKAVSYNADLILMDEPTSPLSETETENLFDCINRLKEKGISIIYISHRVDEIFRICDEITVLRDGEYIGTDLTSNMTRERLFKMMVGRELKDYFIKTDRAIGDVIFEVKNLGRKGKFRNVSFKLRKGEILGISGLVGAGRTEIVESIFGFHPCDEGEIFKDGRKIKIESIQDAIKNKIALASEERKMYGIFSMLSVKHNISMCSLDQFINNLNLINFSAENQVTAEISKALNVKTPSLNQEVNYLSGGNQQKVVLAKWLLTDPDILILDEPTRGIDVGAKSEIYAIMDEFTKRGKSIIMISSEMPEIIGISDRILVVRRGEISAEFDKSEVSQEKIIEFAS
jgi:inositol transport system ATP-binding protein